jgi:predicted aspartyl protease
MCRNSNDAADKIAHCSNVIAHSSNVSALVTAHNTRGLALMDAGRFSEAVDDFSFVIRREPIAGFYDNRQNAYRRSGRLDEALKDANEAIRLARTYSFVFRGRANVYNDMGKYDLAVLDYDQAIRLAPDDGGLFIDRGKILRTQSKLDQAISDFSHALDLGKKWTAAYRERGLTYELMGQSQQAVDDLATYDQLQPGDQEVALALIELGYRQPSAQLGNTPSPSVPSKEVVPETSGGSGTTIVPMLAEAGTFVVPVRINDQITLKFVIDSGASDVTVPADVVMTLLRTGTISDADFLGTQKYRMADGSTVPSQQFVIRSLKVGDRTLNDVTGSIAPVEGSLLLGQSFLRRFKSWSIDNQREALILN